MATIGHADEYAAFLFHGLTGQTIMELPWSAMAWSRMRNEIAQASVTIAAEEGGIDCCSPVWPLRAWEWMLGIYRNGHLTYDGPITGWSRPSTAQGGDGRFIIRSHDRLAITMKRLVALTRKGLIDPGELFYHLLNDAQIGTLAGSPYVYNLPTLAEFMAKPAAKLDLSVAVSRLERVYDALAALVAQGAISYAQVLNTLHVDPKAVRGLLGGRGERPVLNEATVINIPGVEVDAFGVATVAYGGSLGTGKSGYPVVSVAPDLYSVYLSSTLEVGQQFDRPSEINPLWGTGLGAYTTQLDVATQVLAVESAVPSVTIEQVTVSPDFGGKLLADDLSNLVPGAIIDIDFQETCAFEQPYWGVADEYRYWYSYTPDLPGATEIDVYSYMPTPVSSDRIGAATLERIDVAVGFSEDDGLTEDFQISLTPTAEWDGTIPDWWSDPSRPLPSGRYPGA